MAIYDKVGQVIFFLILTFNVSSIHVTNKGRFRYVARVSYDGTRFKGFQYQDEKSHHIRTVQGELNEAIAKRIGYKSKISTSSASRTDVGVHANGQAIHFDLEPNILNAPLDKFEWSINAILPPDLKIYNFSLAPLGTFDQVLIGEPFHATKSAKGKRYIYRFCTNAFVEPIRRNYYAHFYNPIDISLFEYCLFQFVGTHNFTSYGNSIERTTRDLLASRYELDTMRTVYSIKLVDEGHGYYHIDFHLRSALYKMIRNIVGTCYRVSTGKMSLKELQSLLHSPVSRTLNPAKSAPPEGLCLEKVFYDHY